LLDWLHKMFSRDLAIDLGTANTLIYIRCFGIVSFEPSLFAVRYVFWFGRFVLLFGKVA
jgi:rod shape-determining protein MreB